MGSLNSDRFLTHFVALNLAILNQAKISTIYEHSIVKELLSTSKE